MMFKETTSNKPKDPYEEMLRAFKEQQNEYASQHLRYDLKSLEDAAFGKLRANRDTEDEGTELTPYEYTGTTAPEVIATPAPPAPPPSPPSSPPSGLGSMSIDSKLLPIFVVTAFFGAVFIIGPLLVRKGANKGIVRVCIMMTAFCMWLLAAKDGLLEVLREATRKECNNKDESGMTPTLWAAFEGHIEALRLLCGRGGEPDKADYFGNTALHLAAARGHRECVTFLVNFGANVYAMDVDGHTAQELAGINGREDIMRFLDQATGKLENNDKKKAKSLKEKAKKDHEKLQKQYTKRQSKAEVMAERELRKLAKEWETEVPTMPHRPSNVLMALKQRMIRSSSSGNLLADDQPRPTYSALVGTVNSGARGRGAVYKKALASKLRNGTLTRNGPTDDFKVGEVETTGRRSVTSLSGLRRDSEVMYVGTFGAGPAARGAVADVFDAPADKPARAQLTRSASQPDFLAAQNEDSGIGQEVLLQEPASIFDRPGFGSVAFRRSITATLSALPASEELSIGSAGSLAARHTYQPAEWNDRNSGSSTITSDDDGETEESAYASLERFLTAWGLSQYIQKFKDEQIDLDALMLLTESDLKSLGLPLGPYRKLVTAVQERKQALSHPGPMIDTAI